MDLSLVTWALCHARIDIIIGLSSLALWISVMHFEVFRGRASWEYLESLIQFLIGLTHVESPGYPLAASLNPIWRFSVVCEGIRYPQQLLSFPRIGKSASIVESADFWCTNQHSSGCQVIPFLWSPDAWRTNCSPGSLWKHLLSGCSITGISYTHRAHHTHTSPPAGSTGLPEAKLEMQGAFSFSFLGKAFCSVNAPRTKQQKAVSKAPDD